MIKLSEHRTSLINLKFTIDALENIDTLIKWYSKDKPGPAYCEFSHVDGPGKVSIQFDRNIIIAALNAQRESLVNYCATLGIEV